MKKKPIAWTKRRIYLTHKRYAAEHRQAYRDYHKKFSQTVKGRWALYRTNAKRRGIEFSLTKEEFSSFEGKPCYHCGQTTMRIGIDRLDNEMGYTKENSVSCCEMCNMMKRHHEVNIFIEHCAKIARHYGYK